MKLLAVLALFSSLNSWADLPRTNSSIRDPKKIAKILAENHNELVEEDCIKNQTLNSDTLRSELAAGAKIYEVTFYHWYNRIDGRNYFSGFANTEIGQTEFNCVLK